MPILRVISLTLPLNLHLIWLITSETKRTLSRIERFSTKVYCYWEMHLVRMCLSPLARTLKMIL
ncbi:hypothetical protein GLYMA_11G137033v4 [Glycine max]|nr:hypothetical protein GLYMA_11G137033v4 [Glycine max]KAH1159031.1 hypothetical protein GYH30_030975 [Glycine max]